MRNNDKIMLLREQLATLKVRLAKLRVSNKWWHSQCFKIRNQIIIGALLLIISFSGVLLPYIKSFYISGLPPFIDETAAFIFTLTLFWIARSTYLLRKARLTLYKTNIYIAETETAIQEGEQLLVSYLTEERNND